MRLTNRRGRLRMRLDPVEVALLQRLLDELADVLEADAEPGDPVRARLYPAAYRDDPEAESEFRTLTESGLQAERDERIATCRAQLAEADAAARTGGPAGVELADPDDARRWIQVLNDLRLALGTRLGITEDSEPGELAQDVGDPQFVYYWLTAVQDIIVRALMD